MKSSKYNREELVTLFRKGEDCKSIGNLYGVSENAVRKACQRLKIKPSSFIISSNNKEKHICEFCGKEHDGSFASGRFCSSKCAKMFSLSYKNKETVNKSIEDSNFEKSNESTNREEILEKTRIVLIPEEKKEPKPEALRELTSSELGSAGEMGTMAYLSRLGIHISKPISDYKYDMVIDLGNRLYKVQVKTTYKKSIDKATFNLTSSNGAYKKGDIDYFALYIYKDDTLMMVPFELLEGRSSVTITINSKQNSSDLFFWRDYTPVKVFKDYIY